MQAFPLILRRPQLLIGLTATLLAIVLTYWLHHTLDRSELSLLSKGPLRGDPGAALLHHDFDKNGASEVIFVLNNRETAYYRLMVRKASSGVEQYGGIIDQCNFQEPVYYTLSRKAIFFADFNHDGMDDIFTFTAHQDSIFLYVHDLRKTSVVLERIFFHRLKSFNPRNENRFPRIHFGGLVNRPAGGESMFAFTLGDGPDRIVGIFDIDRRRMHRTFTSGIYWSDIFQFDFNGDGIDEIISCGLAVGTIKDTMTYKDDRCWLHIFDQDLKILSRQSFGEYPSTMTVQPYLRGSDKSLVINYLYGGPKEHLDNISFIDAAGRISYEKSLDLMNAVVMNEAAYPPTFFGVQAPGRLIELDSDLRIIREAPFADGFASPAFAKDISGDGRPELICLTATEIQIYNHLLSYKASYDLPPSPGTLTFRETGQGKPVHISLNSKDAYMIFGLTEPRFIPWPLSVLLLASLLFALFTALFRVISSTLLHRHLATRLLHSGDSGILLLAANGRILKVNRHFFTMLHLHWRETDQLHYRAALSGEHQLVGLIEHGLQSHLEHAAQVTLRDGRLSLPGEARISPILLLRWWILAWRLELQPGSDATQTDRLRVWNRMIRQIAHDIKSPLLAVGSNIEVLKKRLERSNIENRREFEADLADIQSELRHIRDLTKKFVKFSQLKPPTYEDVDVREMVTKAITDFRHFQSEDLVITSEIDDDCQTAWTDADYIALVFHVLIENAIEALRGSGQIAISATLSEELPPANGHHINFEIADTGPGIPEDIRNTIFDPGFSTKVGGNGMGLAFAKEIIEENGGRFALHSRENFGTVFRFFLPASAASITSQAAMPIGRRTDRN